MGYSRLDYPYAGGAQDFAVNFALGYIDIADVQVYVIGEVDGLGAQTYRAYTWVNAGTIRVTAALPNPATVVVIRTVAKTQLEIDLESTGAVTRVTLTRAFKQLMMNIHELLDGRADAFQGVMFDVVRGLRDQALAYRDAALGHSNTALTQANLSDTARAASVVAKDAAVASQTASAGSATAASGSATTASGAATAAQAARDLALGYRDTALTHKNAAAGSETASAGSASSATGSATSASGSATTATTQAGIATTQATAASASATAAAASAGSMVKATSPQALAGTDDTAYMTALKTAQQVSQATTPLAPLASPTFTGVPAVPTATAGTNTTQAASTAFVTAASGGMTLLGTLATTSGTTQTLSGLDLTTYKSVFVAVLGVSFTTAAFLTMGGGQISPALAAATDVFMGHIVINLGAASTGVVVGLIGAGAGTGVRTGVMYNFAASISTASTSLSFGGGTFDAGSIRIYGVK